MRNKRTLLFSALISTILSAALFLGGCNDEIGSLPNIEKILVIPDTVAINGQAQVIVQASDADDLQSRLIYYYTMNGGSINGSGDTVMWNAPGVAGKYTLNVLVSDPEGNQSVDSTHIIVVSSQKGIISGSASFPSTMNFDLSGSWVRLYGSYSAWTHEEYLSKVAVFGFGPIVSFQFLEVDSGSYYVEVWKDIDVSSKRNTGDFIGWYGKGSYYAPEFYPVTLDKGESKQVQILMGIVPQ